MIGPDSRWPGLQDSTVNERPDGKGDQGAMAGKHGRHQLSNVAQKSISGPSQNKNVDQVLLSRFRRKETFKPLWKALFHPYLILFSFFQTGFFF